MNLGQAVSLCLYEIAQNVVARSKAKTQVRVQSDGLERLTATLIEALQISGYLKNETAASTQKIRRMVRNLNPSAEDATTLLGMLRQMLWKMLG